MHVSIAPHGQIEFPISSVWTVIQTGVAWDINLVDPEMCLSHADPKPMIKTCFWHKKNFSIMKYA